jgi:hypothetical protein
MINREIVNEAIEKMVLQGYKIETLRVLLNKSDYNKFLYRPVETITPKTVIDNVERVNISIDNCIQDGIFYVVTWLASTSH